MVVEINGDTPFYMHGIAYVVCSKPQFLSDIEAFNAFHSSACVLLYRAPLRRFWISEIQTSEVPL